MKIVTVVTFVAVVLSVARSTMLSSLIWTIYLVISLNKADGQLTLVRHVNSVSCVASGPSRGSALAWVEPADQLNKTIKSSWTFPKTNVFKNLQDKLTCELTTNNCPAWTKAGGKIVSKREAELPNPVTLGKVLDHRWESFKTCKTNGKNEYAHKTAIEAPVNTYETVIVDFSVLASDHAHLVFYDGTNPETSPAYLVIISKIGTQLRRCDRGVPGVEQDVNTKCKKFVTKKERISLNLKEWLHFTINFNKNEKNTIKITLQFGSMSQQMEDKSPIHFNHMSFETKNMIGYWKIHDYSVLSLTTDLELSIPKVTVPMSLCLVVVYVSRYEGAKLIVKQNEEAITEFKLEQADGKWQTGRLTATLSPNKDYKLMIEHRPYLYFGDIRVCSDDEVHVSSLQADRSTEAECTQLRSNISVRFSAKSTSPSPSSCADSKFGPHCNLTCDMVLGLSSCRGVSVCQGNSCSCVEQRYEGDFCHQTLSIAKTSPQLVAVREKSIEVKISDKVVSDAGRIIQEFIIEIKESGSNNIWQSAVGPFNWPPGLTSYNLTKGLSSKTSYQIRTVLIEINEKSYRGEDIPTLSVTTLCQPVESSSINFHPQGSKINVTWTQQTTPGSCDLIDYSVQVDNRPRESVTSLPKVLEGLDNFSPYNVRVFVGERIVKEEIVNTQEGPPEKVQNLQCISDNGSLTVHWDPPSKPNGKIDHYTFTYQDKRGISGTPKEAIKVTGLTHRITVRENLTYYVTVTAFNNQMGQSETTECMPLTDKKQTATNSTDTFTLVIVLCTILAVLLLGLVLLVVWGRRRKMRAHIIDQQRLDDITSDLGAGGVVIPSELDAVPMSDFVRPRSFSRTSSGRRNSVVRPFRPAVPEPAQKAPEAAPPVTDLGGPRLSKSVPLEDLEEYVTSMMSSGKLREQHALFPRGQTQPWDYGRLPENKAKNRYGNLVAYDATRVKLPLLPGVPCSDYINANYIDGYNAPRAYIATQGPKKNTLSDFWRMAWLEDVHLILAVANCVEGGKPKVEQYWPEVSKKEVHGDVIITNTSQEIFADFTFRKLEVCCGGEKRKVLQLHFTSWPDHGVPMYPQTLATYIKKIFALRIKGPTLVHCSAGVGRTGTIILAVSCLRMATTERRVDPLGLLQKMRDQRPNMVDNAEQYELVHLVLLECLVTDSFNVACTQFPQHFKKLLSGGRSALSNELSRLNATCQRDSLHNNMTEHVSWPTHKCRFPDIAPRNTGRVKLPRSDDFINAVYAGGFRQKDQYVVTQLPQPDTVQDFWEMTVHVGAGLVLVLNQPEPSKDQTTCSFYPDAGELQVSDSICVEMKGGRSDTKLLERRELRINVQTTLRLTQHSVTTLTLKGWPSGQEVPPSSHHLLEFLIEADKVYMGKGPIIVVCHDGCTASGLYLAISFVVEKMKLEQEVDVGLAVRTIRTTRPNFISSQDQYESIYQAAMTFLQSFDTYANFT